MPPLSFTQSKYAFAMFGMSVKSVPGCFVAIAPSLIGAPVAFLPLPAPHFGAATVLPPPPPPPLLLLLPPHPASSTATSTTSAAVIVPPRPPTFVPTAPPPYV